MKLYQNREWLYQKYWIEELSLHQIKRICKAGYGTIQYWMVKLNINVRTLNKAMKLNRNRPEVKKKYKETFSCPDWKKRRSKVQKIAQNRPGMKCKQSERSKKLWDTSEYREKTSVAIKIAANQPETKRRTSEAAKAAFKRPEVRKKHREAVKLALNNPEIKKKKEQNAKIVFASPEYKEMRRKISKKLWTDPKFLKKMFRATKKRPTNPEKIFDELTPDVVRYVGNGQWWRNRHNPDFKITGQNKVIEIYGDYWHRNDNPEDRIKEYREMKLDCIIFWENEVYKEPERILKEVNIFITCPVIL